MVHQQGRTAGVRRRPPGAPLTEAPFSSFLSRDEQRRVRQRRTRRTIVVSIAIHVMAVLGLVAYSFVDIEELFGPSVQVTFFRSGAANAPATGRPAGSVPVQLPAPAGPAPVKAPAVR